jgi:hypothetical protein
MIRYLPYNLQPLIHITDHNDQLLNHIILTISCPDKRLETCSKSARILDFRKGSERSLLSRSKSRSKQVPKIKEKKRKKKARSEFLDLTKAGSGPEFKSESTLTKKLDSGPHLHECADRRSYLSWKVQHLPIACLILAD